MASSKIYVILDPSVGCWQLPLDKAYQTCQLLITSDGICTFTRDLHVTTNSVIYLPVVFGSMLSLNFWDRLLYWFGDILILTNSIQSLFENIIIHFNRSFLHSIRLHSLRKVSFSKSIWCRGRVISMDGIRSDLARLPVLTNIGPPALCSQL